MDDQFSHMLVSKTATYALQHGLRAVTEIIKA